MISDIGSNLHPSTTHSTHPHTPIANTNFQLPITPTSTSSATHPISPFDSEQTFEDLLQTHELDLPPPGPSYYAARRALWLTPRSPSLPRPPEPSTSRRRLEDLLNTPGAVFNDEVWTSGIEKVWKGLASGGKLKRRLPMNLIIKIIHSAWLRDDTWPTGAVAPEPDDVLVDIPDFTWKYPPSSAGPTEYSSGVTTPWLVVNGDEPLAEDRSPSSLATTVDHC